MPEEQTSRQAIVVHPYLPDVQCTPVGAYWWHVRINGNDGVLDMHLELRWGVGHVALLVFVFQHWAEFDDLENASLSPIVS